MRRRKRRWLRILFGGVALAFGAAACFLPEIGSIMLLHPIRRPMIVATPSSCQERTFDGDKVTLKGWFSPALGTRRGTLIYLHGVADNRASGAGTIARFRKLGFDVVAYDSRAHGQSGGDSCTYGFFEKRDLSRVIATVGPGPVFLFGSSLGAAVALQEAAGDPRVTAVIAAESFSDLRTVATERAPFFFTAGTIRKAFELAEKGGHFQINDASPLEAARRIKIPVLLIHGADDRDTPPSHARRLLAALAGPKRLILVPGARHNESLSGKDVWKEIDAWIDGHGE